MLGSNVSFENNLTKRCFWCK